MSRLLMIGLDAAEPALIERWAREGRMPNLEALCRAGASGRIESSARFLAGSPWPTFYTGLPVSHHGIYHDYQWRQKRMGYSRPSWDWLPATPFWRSLEPDVRVVAYDVPMTLGCQGAVGVEVAGWASHDKLSPPATHPPGLAKRIEQEFGFWPMWPEGYGPSTLRELLALREHLLQNTKRSVALASTLLREPWDLGIVVFSALHRGGHRFWDRTSIADEGSAAECRIFDGALADLYAECDRAVGDLAASFPDATVIVFSLHGMGENTSRVDMLDGMLAKVLGGPGAEEPRHGRLRRLGEALPIGVRRHLTKAVPLRLRDGIMTRWATGGVDWSRVEAFTLRADLQGYIRISLAGREPEGIVPAERYDDLCEHISEGLLSFRDRDTGLPAVSQVRRTQEVFTAGPRADRLPDLIVQWHDSSAVRHRALASRRHGTVVRSTPGRIPNGRAGNHRFEGFFAVKGRGIVPDSRIPPDAHILDLAPTVLGLLGARTVAPLAGVPIQIPGLESID